MNTTSKPTGVNPQDLPNRPTLTSPAIPEGSPIANRLHALIAEWHNMVQVLDIMKRKHEGQGWAEDTAEYGKIVGASKALRRSIRGLEAVLEGAQ